MGLYNKPTVFEVAYAQYIVTMRHDCLSLSATRDAVVSKRNVNRQANNNGPVIAIHRIISSDVGLKSCQVIAKFHYTDPTGPGSPTKSAHVVGYSSYPTTCADFFGDPGPVGSV